MGSIINATDKSIYTPQIIFPDRIKNHIINISTVTEIEPRASVTISFQIEDTQAALVALHIWQMEFNVGKKEAY